MMEDFLLTHIFISMNLHEQISRIQSMMGLITEEQDVAASITGGYKVSPSNCDALHSFEKLGKMNSKVNAKLMELYKQGINPDIKSVDVVLDSKKGTATFNVVVGKSTDGKAWIGLDSAGGGAANGLSSNPSYPKNLTAQSGHASTKDRRSAKSIRKRGTVVEMVPIHTLEHYPQVGCKVKQIFHKYTLEQYPPHETKAEEEPMEKLPYAPIEPLKRYKDDSEIVVGRKTIPTTPPKKDNLVSRLFNK
jgi:hypothetical protein